MGSNQKLIQWNCRGLKANYSDFDILLKVLSPAAICLQETLQSDTNVIKLRHYVQYVKNSVKQDGSPQGGVSVIVRNDIPHSQLSLTTTLQATAVRITLHRTITLCSIYISPSDTCNQHDLADLLTQLPPPIVLMGDFNAHSPLWGDKLLDRRGKIVEDFINYNNLCSINDKTSTYIHSATGAKTSIDITIADPSLLLDLSWRVHDDLCGSDHFPIVVTSNKPIPPSRVPTWKLKKATGHFFNNYAKNI